MADEKESAIDRLRNNLESTNKRALNDLKSELKQNNAINDLKSEPKQNNVKGGSSSSGGGGKAGANPMKTGTLSPFNMKKGGVVSSASKRADGCCIRGKTRAK